MGRLIRMDFRRLFYSKVFWISGGLLFVLQTLIAFFYPLLMNWVGSLNEGFERQIHEWNIANILHEPYYILMMIIPFITVVSFCYADLANGYFKNIAGQIPNKGNTALSKFVVIIFQVCYFTVLAVLGYIIGKAICPDAKYVGGGDFEAALKTLIIKSLLMLAMCTILLFVVAALRSKTFGSVMGVLLGLGALSTIYGLLDMLVGNVLKDVKIENYAPSALYSMDFSAAKDATHAVVIAVLYIVVFLIASVKVIKEKDVK